MRTNVTGTLSVDANSRAAAAAAAASRMWRCLSYRGSAGGYLFIECRGVAALQMRSSQ